MIKKWKHLGSPVITQVGWRTIVTKKFELPDGRKEEFQLYGGKETACIIPITKDKQVITVLQFRPGPEKIMHEIPGGFVDIKGSDPMDAAIRELGEETGYKPGEVSYIGTVYIDAYSSVERHYYFAENCVHVPGLQNLSGTEFIEVELVDIVTFMKNAHKGLMTDTQAVFLAYEKLKKLEKDSEQ